MNSRDAQRAFVRAISERIGRRLARVVWNGGALEKLWPLAVGLLIGFAAGSHLGFKRGLEQARQRPDDSPYLKGTVTPAEIEAMESGQSPWPDTDGKTQRSKQTKSRH